jgi:hypothetical protein
LAIWSDLQQKKKLSTEYQSKPIEVAQQIARCDRATEKAPNK